MRLLRTSFATVAAATMMTGLAAGMPAQAAPETAAQPLSNASEIAKLYPNSDVTVTGDIRVLSYTVSPSGDAGAVKFDGVGTVSVTPKKSTSGLAALTAGITTVDVGGGRWKYGSTLNAAGQKSCISYYYHPSTSHSSSVRMDVYDRATAGAGGTSYARVTRYTRTICETYYNRS